MTRYAENQPKTTIRITAEGRCRVEPDSVRVDLGILAYGENLEEAKRQLEKKRELFFGAVNNAGLDFGRHWEGEVYYTEPKPAYAEYLNDEKLSKHELSQGLHWQMPLDHKILDVFCKAFHGVLPEDDLTLVYGCENRTVYRDRAIKDALAEAKLHIETIAAEGGLKLGRVVKIEVGPETLDQWHNVHMVRHYSVFLNTKRIYSNLYPPDHILTEHILVEWELEQKDG